MFEILSERHGDKGSETLVNEGGFNFRFMPCDGVWMDRWINHFAPCLM